MTAAMGLILFLLIVQIGLLLVSILNALTVPKLRQFSKNSTKLLNRDTEVAILIPARDEAARLPDTLAQLANQLTDKTTLKVLDDGSMDNTRVIIEDYQRTDPRIHMLEGKPLPPGWTGKNWACHQLAESSRTDHLIFTDADVNWQEGALAAVQQAAHQLQADMLTVWPTQKMETIWERLVVPMMSFSTLAYLPWLGVHHLPFASMAAANGQCLFFSRQAYDQVGGHQAVRSSVIEDITLARRTKQQGLRLRMLDGDGLISCRMYTDWPSVRDGYAKNILAGHGTPFLLLLSIIFHWLVFLFPWFWLLTGWLFTTWPLLNVQLWPTLPLAMVLLTTSSRLMSAAITHQPLRDAFLLPVSVLLMTVIAIRALSWHFSDGGPSWKGRRIPTKTGGTTGPSP